MDVDSRPGLSAFFPTRPSVAAPFATSFITESLSLTETRTWTLGNRSRNDERRAER
jgi:hypothetical protein